jgi:hypothetical protein
VFDVILERTGRWATNHRWAVVITWIILAAAVTLLAPSIDSVVSSDTRDLLPSNAPYLQAEEVLKSRFPAQYSDGTTVIATETTRLNIHDEAPWSYLDKLTQWLQSADAPRNITTVLSPVSTMPLMGDAMLAKDGHLALILIEFNTDTTAPATIDALRSIENYLDQNAVEGVKSYLTGTPPIIDSYSGVALGVSSMESRCVRRAAPARFIARRWSVHPADGRCIAYLIPRTRRLPRQIRVTISPHLELLIVILLAPGRTTAWRDQPLPRGTYRRRQRRRQPSEHCAAWARPSPAAPGRHRRS